MPKPIEITTDCEFYLGGIRFGAGTYEITLVKDAHPWRCDYCDQMLPTRDAPCPIHGAPTAAGWCPF